MGVIEESHNFELVDKSHRIFASPFGDAFDDSGPVGEHFLSGLVSNSIGPSSDFLHLLTITLIKSKCSLICSLWLLMKNSLLSR